MFEYRQATALITGASSGIGEAFAFALARRGVSLILVARTKPKLDELAKRLGHEHGIQATVIEADLAERNAPERLHARVADLGLRVDLLVNNAGFTLSGDFLSHDLSQEEQQLHVDVGALIGLAHFFVKDMVARKQGAVINLASITSFMPITHSAVYGASKSFVLSFSEALAREVAGTGVRVLALCPGPVASGFYDRIGVNPPRTLLATPERVVAEALSALDRGRSVVVAGGSMIRMLAFGTRLLPRSINVRIGERIGRQYFVNDKKAVSAPSQTTR
jgi:short-subunit dehydrogenase